MTSCPSCGSRDCDRDGCDVFAANDMQAAEVAFDARLSDDDRARMESEEE